MNWVPNIKQTVWYTIELISKFESENLEVRNKHSKKLLEVGSNQRLHSIGAYLLLTKQSFLYNLFDDTHAWRH